MLNTWSYIERLRAMHGGCSDYRIAQILGVSTQAMSNYKLGLREADDEVAMRISQALGIDARLVIANLHLNKADEVQNSGLAEVWRSFGKAALEQVSFHLTSDVNKSNFDWLRQALTPAFCLDDGVVEKGLRAMGAEQSISGAIARDRRRSALKGRKAASICWDGGDGRNRTADLGVMNPSL